MYTLEDHLGVALCYNILPRLEVRTIKTMVYFKMIYALLSSVTYDLKLHGAIIFLNYNVSSYQVKLFVLYNVQTTCLTFVGKTIYIAM